MPFDVLNIGRACYIGTQMYNKLLSKKWHPDKIELKPWQDIPQYEREYWLFKASIYLENQTASAEDVHAKWLVEKYNQGWSYGKVHCDRMKTHPALLAYSALPLDRVLTEGCFRDMVDSLRDFEGKPIEFKE